MRGMKLCGSSFYLLLGKNHNNKPCQLTLSYDTELPNDRISYRQATNDKFRKMILSQISYIFTIFLSHKKRWIWSYIECQEIYSEIPFACDFKRKNRSTWWCIVVIWWHIMLLYLEDITTVDTVWLSEAIWRHGSFYDNISRSLVSSVLKFKSRGNLACVSGNSALKPHAKFQHDINIWKKQKSCGFQILWQGFLLISGTTMGAVAI